MDLNKNEQKKQNKRTAWAIRTQWDDPAVFNSESGNGLAVPQYELNEKGESVPKLDNKGNHVTKNLYADIQLMANTNDYKRILGLNGGDTSVYVVPSENEFNDVSNSGEAIDVLNAQSRLREKFPGMDLKQIAATIQAQFERELNDIKLATEKTKADVKDIVNENKEVKDDKEKK